MRASFLSLVVGLTLSGLLSATAGPPDAGAKRGPYVKARMVKDRFVEGEPIGITLSITNPGPGTIELLFASPPEFFFGRDFEFARKDPLFSIHGEGPNHLTQRPPRTLMGGTGPMGVGTTSLLPGVTWAATILLQDNYEQPHLGKYILSYHFKKPFLKEGPHHERLDRENLERLDRKNLPFASTQGVLRFEVVPAEPGDLKRILDGYWWRIKHPDPPEQVVIDWAFSILNPIVTKGHSDTPRYQVASVLDEWLEEISEQVDLLRPEGEGELRVAEAIAALSAVEDPIVIPYLARIIDANSDADAMNPEYGFEALERFHTNKQAQQAVIKLLKTPRHAARAREWLADPNTGLGIDELERIFKQGR